MPFFGFGVYLSPPGSVTFSSVTYALNVGYRHIDTASIYKNEADVGKAIKASNCSRDKIFVTTKLWNSDQGFHSTLKALDQSLQELQLDYVDLYLIHWPLPKKRIESWNALINLQANERCRSIGVSNFEISHLQELMNETEIVPAVNQIECSPFLYQRDLIHFCQNHHIVVQAYSPLTAGKRLYDNLLQRLSQKYKKTPAQILIRWSLQHHLVPLPKSINFDRILENSLVFDFFLESNDMKYLDSLNENFRTCWDPSIEP